MTPFRSRLALETLDRRDVPASLADPNVPMATEVRYIPPGCWPGPPPMYRVSLTLPVVNPAEINQTLPNAGR